MLAYPRPSWGAASFKPPPKQARPPFSLRAWLASTAAAFATGDAKKLAADERAAEALRALRLQYTAADQALEERMAKRCQQLRLDEKLDLELEASERARRLGDRVVVSCICTVFFLWTPVSTGLKNPALAQLLRNGLACRPLERSVVQGSWRDW